MFHLFDLIVLAFVIYGVRRGRRRGLIVELPGAVSALAFFLTGWGLFKVLYRGVSAANAWIGFSLGIISFAVVIFISIKLWLRLRARIRARAEKNIDQRYWPVGGAIAGGVWALVWGCIVLLVMAHTFFAFAVRGSFIGDFLIEFVLPVYEKTHH